MPQHAPSAEFSVLPVAKPLYGQRGESLHRVLTPEQLEASYLQQWYRLETREAHFAVRPDDAAHAELWPEPTNDHPELEELWGSFVMTPWHQPGEDSTKELRDERQDALEETLAMAHTWGERVAVIDQHSRWMEPGMLCGFNRDTAFSMASYLGQPVIVRLERDLARVMWVDGSRPNRETRFTVHRLPAPPCPMSLGMELSQPPQPDGGPWVSRSREVAAMWQAQFQLAHELLPCVVHPPGATMSPGRGRAIALMEVTPPSRWHRSGFVHP